MYVHLIVSKLSYIVCSCFRFHYTNALIQVDNKKNSEDIRWNVLKLHWSRNVGKSPLTHELNQKKQTQMKNTSLLKFSCTRFNLLVISFWYSAVNSFYFSTSLADFWKDDIDFQYINSPKPVQGDVHYTLSPRSVHHSISPGQQCSSLFPPTQFTLNYSTFTNLWCTTTTNISTNLVHNSHQYIH